MTESEKALEVAISFEAKKNGFVQVQSGDIKISLTVAGNEMPKEFLNADMSQRYSVVMVAIDTDEQPIKIEAKKPNNGNVSQAAMLCNDEEYKEWLRLVHKNLWRPYAVVCDGSQGAATQCMYKLVEIGSRSEVSSGEPAKRFKRHVAEFNAWRRGE